MNLNCKFIYIFIIILFSSCNKDFYKKKNYTYYDAVAYPFIIDNRHSSKNFNKRIRFLVLHYTAENFESSIKTLTEKEKKVSSHYLIPETPINGERKIFLLVSENLSAWHAGKSYWQNRTNLNDTSIGIEMVYLGYRYENGLHKRRIWIPFTNYQINILIHLANDIIHRYDIQPTAIVGHSDISPGRKMDPGPLFPWNKLANHGIGAWFDKEKVEKIKKRIHNKNINILSMQKKLKKYGYKIKETGKLDIQTKKVLSAFQIHFRPNNYSGEPDEETIAILNNLIEKYFFLKK
ncbi:N-acetylmuramoyl-L-alanine amidase [Blattabacterium cuenoti]|uniref:N-acetylmuramoyl-L-alanine amidase n=1 Tax=Blattabacterium cuenoti TaxID=1653831 RepID=UPI001932ACA3|nr:N-acetylmuramoyl-L-alanine amidase [Blattabacterium cuenoti]